MLDEVKRIPLASTRAEIAALNAVSAAEEDAALGRQALNQCLSLLDDLREPEDRLPALVMVARAWHGLNDDKAAWEALESSLAGAVSLLRRDTAADAPNQAPREYWPSTSAIRVVAGWARLFDAKAETLLPNIADTDLALLARIEMARGRLGHAIPQPGMQVTRSAR